MGLSQQEERGCFLRQSGWPQTEFPFSRPLSPTTSRFLLSGPRGFKFTFNLSCGVLAGIWPEPGVGGRKSVVSFELYGWGELLRGWNCHLLFTGTPSPSPIQSFSSAGCQVWRWWSRKNNLRSCCWLALSWCRIKNIILFRWLLAN